MSDRLAEIRQRAEAGDYHCREHFAQFDADEDVLWLLAERDQAEAEREALKAELARVQGLPELPWAEVCAGLMQRFAMLARRGAQGDAKELLAVLDKGKTYVTRLGARAEKAEAALDALRQAQQSIDCPLCGEEVKQVASATLSIALWQHINWTCHVTKTFSLKSQVPTPPQEDQ